MIKFHLNTVSKLACSIGALAIGGVGTPALALAQNVPAETFTVPATQETGATTQSVEITLYDAETIARVNQEVKVASSDQSGPGQETIVETDAQMKGVVIGGNSEVAVEGESDIATTAEVTTGAMLENESISEEDAEENSEPEFPRDISDQVFEVIAGVPIIENPQKCDTDELDIDITITNVSSSKGTIVIDLHNDVDEDFLVWDRVVTRVRVSATKDVTKTCMPLIQPGDYAIAIYHDKNGNKEFDKNFLGLPKERFGMSRDPKFGTKSPKLEETIFTVPETGRKINITLFSTGDILGGRKKK